MKLKKIINNLWIFRSIIQSIYFNFHYLPFKQAVKLPILLRKPKLVKCSGSVKIIGKAKFGMIQLGRFKIPLYPDSGLIFENNGEIIFNGSCFIGNASAISVGQTGKLILGNNFCATSSFRVVCYSTIKIQEGTLIGWNSTIMDTDLHKLQSTEKQGHTNRGGYRPIIIGKNCWIGMGCTILKGVCIPDYTTVSACSILNQRIANLNEYSVIGTEIKIVVKKTGVFRNPNDDKIDYYSPQ